MLAPPRDVCFVRFKVRAGAGPVFAFLPDEVNLSGVVKRIDAVAFVGFRGNEGSVLRAFLAGLKLCLGHNDLLLIVKDWVLKEPISA
jgi:hypothetical protein